MEALERDAAKVTRTLPKAANGIKQTGRAAGTATGNIQRMGIALRTTVGPIVALYAAFNFLNKSLQVASERQVNVAKLANGLRNLGGTQSDLERLRQTADKLGKSTLFDQEDFSQSFALLTSFQRIGVDSYERVAKAAADLATITGTDLKSAQIQLAKALEDPTKRVTDLARSGTVFTDQQKEQIKVLQESGDLLGAQSLILSELEKQYGGAAEAAGSSGLAGAFDTLGEVTRDFQEALVTGNKTAEAAETIILSLAGGIQTLTGYVRDLNAILTALDTIIGKATGGLGSLAGAFEVLQGVIIGSIPGLKEAIFAYEQLARLAGKYNDSQGGERNFGSDYASQERALFEAAGGWTPYKSTAKQDPPKPGPTPVGGGGAASTKAAQREAEAMEKALRSSEQSLEVAKLELKIAEEFNVLTDIALKGELERLKINQKYDNALLSVLSTEEKINIQIERGLKLRQQGVEEADSLKKIFEY